ncbi:MAG TPA: serine/threonine-protein kinase [Polyangiales bacterium]|jgi:serine/threonine protein kinase|nr:serine/threonine-protein kinase [Polyangiales bacterium]
MPKPGDLVASKYVIEQLLGEGGMGAVFAATHRFTGKQVAIKWMLPELARDEDAVHRFMREAQAAGRINHPNVVDVYDVGQHEDSFFLVMELLRGEPLTTALSRRDLTVRELLDLLLRAMRGVSAAHRQGVVHRDLKPDNIFLAYEDDGVGREPKVLDFGISKVSNEGQINPRLTRTGAVVGTPYYMSPEQIRGSDSLDRRADVYAFGVILYEALTGQVPFIADTYGALVLEIATGTPKTPDELVPGLPVALSRVVMRAMARNAQDRFADLESLIHALEPFLHDTVPTREPTGSKKRGFRSSGNSPMSTPFTAEPPPEDPSLLGRPNGRSAMYIALAVLAVGIIWFAFEKLRAPEIPMVSPGPIHATQPELAPPPPSAAPAPASGTATLPSGASTPVDPQPFQQQPSSNTTSRNAATSDTAPKAKAPVAAAKSVAKVHPKPAKPEGAVEPAPPAPAAQPEKAERPGRRARSGPLSVDEF